MNSLVYAMVKKKDTTMKEKTSLFERTFSWYYSKLTILLIIPIILLIISFFSITQTYQDDGTIINRDITLKGGLSVTLTTQEFFSYSAFELQQEFEQHFKDPKHSFSIQELQIGGEIGGFIIDTSISEEEVITFLNSLANTTLSSPQDFTTSFISPTLSQAFFTQALYTLLISFILISIVIFAFFRKIVPSIAIILSIIFDIIVTIGILNAFGIQIGIAGIGALLMLIGYSIDTDILLTNRVIKEKKERRVSNAEHFKEKLKSSFQTGMLMAGTTLSAATVALLITNSPIIFQITLIIIIGLLVDMVSTWIQNTVILKKWYENLKE